ANIEDATNIITLDNTGVVDAASNAGSGSTTSSNYTVDTLRPTATISLADSALTIGETSLVTITFSEAVTGFTNADLTVENGTLSSVSSADGGITWTATFTPTANIEDATNIITLDNTGVVNAASNAGSGTTSSSNYTVDTVDDTAPTVANQSFSYAENQAAGATVASVIASDAVGVTQFRFENAGGTPGATSTDGFFAIDNAGIITITAAGAAAGIDQNDFETGLNAFIYNVQAADTANNWSAAATITLYVTDVDDTAPPLIDQVPADPAPAGTNIQPNDDDGDGLREVVTSADGTSVDGNRDGVPDAQQTEVAGLRLINDGAKGSDYGALVVSPGVQLGGVTLTAPSADGSMPVTARGGGTVVTTTPYGMTNAFAGVVSFDLSGIAPGGATQATISFPSGLPTGSGNAYVRFNYSTNRFEEYVDAAGNPLYAFVDSDGDGSFDAVILTLVDGDLNWDGDGLANGTVVDPGYLASGKRKLKGTQDPDTLQGNILANKIRGHKGNDTLTGGLGNDRLRGGRGNDHLRGGENDDLIRGGKGKDWMRGGRGMDAFWYASKKASLPSKAERDIVKFGRNDRFVFSSFDGDTNTEGLQTLTFIGEMVFSGMAGELRANASVLEADLDGDSVADFAVKLRGSGQISSNNLVL
ncbi:Ig-like domain-containing protein, partial [Vulcanococcus sp. Clear-D1]|uniref:Ig-like domain-containing protein n=1 Tax=Vulcanococcus sp. Clear-D1 TaxID=2766970 RepID=UPI0019BF3AF7